MTTDYLNGCREKDKLRKLILKEGLNNHDQN